MDLFVFCCWLLLLVSSTEAVVYMLLYNHSTEVTGDGVLSACSSKPSACSSDYDAVASRNADYSIKEGDISDLLTSTRGFDWNLTAENYEIWSIYGRLATSWANWFALGKPTTGIFSTATTIWTGKRGLSLPISLLIGSIKDRRPRERTLLQHALVGP